MSIRPESTGPQGQKQALLTIGIFQDNLQFEHGAPQLSRGRLSDFSYLCIRHIILDDGTMFSGVVKWISYE